MRAKRCLLWLVAQEVTSKGGGVPWSRLLASPPGLPFSMVPVCFGGGAACFPPLSWDAVGWEESAGDVRIMGRGP